MKTQREVSKKKRSEKRMKMSRGVRDLKCGHSLVCRMRSLALAHHQ